MYVQELSPCTYKFSVDVKCSGFDDEPTSTTPAFTEPSRNVLQSVVKTLHATYFEPEDRRYDGGQYQYFIDRDFQPKQEPAVDLGSFIRMNKTSHGVIKYFEDGSKFFCPKPRSTIMIFKCGPKNKLTNVYEFLPCVYKFFVDVLCPEGPVPATTDIITEQFLPVTTENPFITEVTESTQSTNTPLSVKDWEVVDGWFAEYPPSLGMNRFVSKHQAFDACVKVADCGGISKNNDGTWECRAWEFVQEYGAISYAKPENFHTRL